MFFYISFLRAPPLQAAPYGTISITPQVSNDLRTEPFEGSQDLYYSWSHCPASSSAPQTPTKPTKLTTWRPSSAYKEIPLPVPSGVREGQRWRLILTSQAKAHGSLHPDSVDLGTASVGAVPFPVMSMPILFSGRGHKGSPKQEMIERTYLLPFHRPKDSEGEIRGEDLEKMPATAVLQFREKTSFDLDKKIWDSGIGLSSWLADLREKPALSETNRLQSLRDSLFSDEPRKILELGAGIGIVSVALAILRSGCRGSLPEQPNDQILVTDVPSAIPLLQENISINQKYYLSTTPKALVLDWDDDDLPEEVKSLGSLDVIVMADVTYNTSSFPALCRTLSRLVAMGSKPPALLLGHKERDDAERQFWDIATEAGIYFEKIGQRVGAGGAPVGIWSGHIRT